MINVRGAKAAIMLLKTQIVLMLIASLIGLMLNGIHACVSVFLGGCVSVLPNACFALILFSHHGAQHAQAIANSFYKGEAVKWVLTVGLFALAFKYVNVVPIAFIIGFIVVQMAFWFAPFIVDNKNK